MKYNDNVELLRVANPFESLTQHEYFALMVKDCPASYGETRVFFDKARWYLGLEQTSGKIYIAKNFVRRNDSRRGVTVVVRVPQPSTCYLLT